MSKGIVGIGTRQARHSLRFPPVPIPANRGKGATGRTGRFKPCRKGWFNRDNPTAARLGNAGFNVNMAPANVRPRKASCFRRPKAAERHQGDKGNQPGGMGGHGFKQASGLDWGQDGNGFVVQDGLGNTFHGVLGRHFLPLAPCEKSPQVRTIASPGGGSVAVAIQERRNLGHAQGGNRRFPLVGGKQRQRELQFPQVLGAATLALFGFKKPLDGIAQQHPRLGRAMVCQDGGDVFRGDAKAFKLSVQPKKPCHPGRGNDGMGSRDRSGSFHGLEDKFPRLAFIAEQDLSPFPMESGGDGDLPAVPAVFENLPDGELNDVAEGFHGRAEFRLPIGTPLTTTKTPETTTNAEGFGRCENPGIARKNRVFRPFRPTSGESPRLVRTAGLEPARLTALPPQSSASANSATCACSWSTFGLSGRGADGRGGEIRTHDLLYPKQARCQATLRPVPKCGRDDGRARAMAATVFSRSSRPPPRLQTRWLARGALLGQRLSRFHERRFEWEAGPEPA